jgi:hypothetical protein
MAFRRMTMPPQRPAPDALTGQMVGLGMNFAAHALVDANIEDTILFASELGMIDDDLRVLGVLTTWIEVHHPYINVDRLVRVLPRHASLRVRAYWAAVANWLDKDRRFARLQKLHGGDRVALLRVGTRFHVERRGEDARFEGTSLVVPAQTLRRRSADVLSPTALAKVHTGYRNRVHLGPSWRADVWTALEKRPDLSTAEVARRAYCAFATAWQARRDFELLRATG